jgi:hypothetical protein
MAKIDAMTVNKWILDCESWMASNSVNARANRLAVVTGRDAWTIAHLAGVVREAYAMDRDIHDAHIQTALQKIFPNAVFRDKKVY